MQYSILIADYEDESADAILEGHSKYLNRIDTFFDEGKSLPVDDILVPIEILVRVVSIRGRMTDHLFLDDIECSLVTMKACSKFQTYGFNNIQFFPVKLIDLYSNADEVEEAKLKEIKLEYKEVDYDHYSIMNVVGLIECVDHEASNLEYYSPRLDIPEDMPEDMRKVLEEEEEDNDIDFIRKLVLDESKIPDDISIFRLKDCPRILVFKEEVVNAIREEKLTGFVFVPLDAYTDEIPDDDDEDDEETTEAKEEETLEAQKPPLKEEKATEKKKSGIIIKSIKKNE